MEDGEPGGVSPGVDSIRGTGPDSNRIGPLRSDRENAVSIVLSKHNS